MSHLAQERRPAIRRSGRRTRASGWRAIAAACSLLLAGASEAQTSGAESRIDAGAILLVRNALTAIGGEGAIARAGGMVLEGSGHVDLGVRLQGMRPDRSEREPLIERFAVDSTGEHFAYESRTMVNSDAEEWIRYAVDGPDLLIMDRLDRRVFRDAGGGGEEMRRRYTRAVPHLLLEEALRDSGSLRSVERSGARKTVRFSLGDEPELLLFFESGSGRLTGFEYQLDMPLTGDTPVRWTFGPYRPINGIGHYPQGHTVELGGRILRQVHYDRVAAGSAGAELFSTPEGLTIPPPRPPRAATADSAPAPPPAAPRPDVRTLADGVYLVPNVRPGFHVLFVEFTQFVLVVDTPAGWHELHQVPAADFTEGMNSSSVGERLLETVRAAVPDKPVRYAALTHHHSDHAGGVRPFVAAGATILGTEPTHHVVQRAVGAPYTLGPDALSQRDAPLQFELVDGERVIRDDSMEVRLIDVGPNPHAEGMLAAWLPRQRILYVSDLFEPRSQAFFPSRARVPVMRWFVEWLDRSGLDPQTIYAIHGSGRVTEEQLAHIRSLPPEH